MLGDVKDDSCGMELPVDYQHYASKHFDYGKGVYISAITLLHGLWHKGTRASERDGLIFHDRDGAIWSVRLERAGKLLK